MGELNHIAEALDNELANLGLGRRASDKFKSQELASLVQELEKVNQSTTSSTSSETFEPHIKNVHYSRDDVVRATDLFFELLMSEENSTAPIRLLLGFLQHPVTASVKKSPKFFIDEKHPARRVIQALFARERDITSEERFQSDPVYLALHKTIKAIVRDYKGDDRLFIKAYYEILGE